MKAKSKYINLSDKLCEFNDTFTMYLTTRLPNPHFSPEDQAKTTVVDFTVTQKGLEEQLLGIVIQKEQRSLEEMLKTVLEEVGGGWCVWCVVCILRPGLPTYPATHPPAHPATHSPIHPFTQSPLHPFTHTPIRPPTHPPTHGQCR